MCLSRIFVSHPQVFNFKGGFAQSKNAQFRLLFKLFCLILNFSVKSSGKSDTGNKISQLLQDEEFTRLNISKLETQSSLPKKKCVHVKCKYHHIAVDLVHACRQSNSQESGGQEVVFWVFQIL